MFAFILLCDPVLWELNYHVPVMFLLLLVLRPAGFVILFVWPFVCLGSIFFRWGQWRLQALLPLVIAILTSLSGYAFNTTHWWLSYNEWRYATGRDAFWLAMKAGEHHSSGEYMGIQTVANWYPDTLSLGGGDVFYRDTPEGPLLLFPTFMGIPDGMSGFLYAPRQIDPKKAWPELQLSLVELWDVERHVYYVDSR